MTGVLGIVYRAIATHLNHKAGYTQKTAHTGAVTLIQRLGSALNLNIHFHMLFVDGVYVNGAKGAIVRFRQVKEPSSGELNQLVHQIAHRAGRYLERQGWLERDAENDYLALDTADDDPLSVLQGPSIAYRIALGPQAGRKVFTLQTLSPVDSDEMHRATVGQVAGFNLHAGVAARGDQRRKLERLCCYVTRPAVSEQRLSLTAQGKVRYQRKTPYRDGTAHVMLLQASCPSPCGPAFGCSKSLPAILSNLWTSFLGWRRWCRNRG